MRHRGFTLMEILIVIVVIAVLSTLVMSVAGLVRSSARTLECANNLREIGVLDECYASDHQGCFAPAYIRNDMGWNWPERPVPYPTGPAKTKWENAARSAAMGVHGESAFGNWSAWHMYLAPYASRDQNDQWTRKLGLERLYNCPAAPLRVVIDTSLNAAGYPFAVSGRIVRTPYQEWLGMSYGVNTAVLGTNDSDSTNYNGGFTVWANFSRRVPGWPGYGVGIDGLRDNSRHRARFSNPGGVIQVAEHWGGLPTTAQGGKFRVFWSDAPFVRPAVGADGAELPRPSGWAWGTSAAGSWPWSADGFDGWALRASHRGRSNYLFIDGHVAAHTPWDLCPDGNPANAPSWTGRF